MNQRLGEKKHRRCEAIGGRKYDGCLVGGGKGVGLAECWFTDEDGDTRNFDYVNYLHKQGPVAVLRKGQWVDARKGPMRWARYTFTIEVSMSSAVQPELQGDLLHEMLSRMSRIAAEPKYEGLAPHVRLED